MAIHYMTCPKCRGEAHLTTDDGILWCDKCGPNPEVEMEKLTLNGVEIVPDDPSNEYSWPTLFERPSKPHSQRTISVLIDVDEGIADLVLYLNTIPGVRTQASCQGTIGEGGAHPYRPQVLVTWPDGPTFYRLRSEFDLSDVHYENQWCYVHPKENNMDTREMFEGERGRESLPETLAAQMLRDFVGCHTSNIHFPRDQRQALFDAIDLLEAPRGRDALSP